MSKGCRTINYLRISITDRCNFKCIYCKPITPFKTIRHSEIARYEEILTIARIAVSTGIDKIRITGGEPFARRGLFSFLEELTRIPGLKDISITTNGALLDDEKIKTLADLGIRRLNFSLDCLDPAIFKSITGKNDLNHVLDVIHKAHASGISPIKINAVILKDINESQIEPLAGLTLDQPYHIRFIEYMPMGTPGNGTLTPVLHQEIQERITRRYGELTPLERSRFDGPAQKFTLENAPGIIGFITPISSHFCDSCNRMRLTARGTLRPCLLNNHEVDILGPLRNRADDSQLEKIFRQALDEKPDKHGLCKRAAGDAPISHMTSIGG